MCGGGRMPSRRASPAFGTAGIRSIVGFVSGLPIVLRRLALLVNWLHVRIAVALTALIATAVLANSVVAHQLESAFNNQAADSLLSCPRARASTSSRVPRGERRLKARF